MPIEQKGRALQTYVTGFQGMKKELQLLMDADLVICSACDAPAKYIDAQDAAEYYPHCLEHHLGFGEQWTGSTRFSPHLLWVAVYPEQAQAWYDAQPPEMRKRWTLTAYDTRDLYSLLPDDFSVYEKRVIAQAGDFKVSLSLRLLKNGEFAYEIQREVGSTHVHHSHHYGLVGTFVSTEEAQAHAMTSGDMPRWVKDAAQTAQE